MIARGRSQSKSSSTPLRAGAAFLHRKCACGGAPGFDSECADCRKKKLRLQRQSLDQREPASMPTSVEQTLSAPGQPLDKDTRSFIESRLGHSFSRLRVESLAPQVTNAEPTVSQPQDAEEQQADEMADEMMRSFRQSATPSPEQDQNSFSTRFDYDLSQVRIHTTSQAAESARDVDALAYTVGTDIVFGEAQYAPDNFTGRRLLAHELAHVIQQAGSAIGEIRPTPIRRAPAPQPPLLERALSGGHSAVKALTRSANWDSLDLTAQDSATLIIILLKGATDDAEEEAGLKIFDKNIKQKRLDDTLFEVDKNGRFGQIFDDFDGKEYVRMLVLLSENIERFYIRKIFLQKLKKEDRMNKDEEKAVVTILSNASWSDGRDLLDRTNSEEYFRSKIDDQQLLLWYERVIAGINQQRRYELAGKTDWRAIFDDQAKKCKKPGLSDQESERLFQENMKELGAEVTREVLTYQSKIEDAAELGSDTGKAAEVNRDFEKSMNQFLSRKRLEFCLELKFDKEFNFDLESIYRTNWTLANLKYMEEFLNNFPPELLEANPQFKSFKKEHTHASEPWVGGFTGSDAITLIGTSAVTHEFGHVVHNADPKLLEDFKNCSKWEKVDAAMITALNAQNSDFQKVLDRLDEKRKNKSSGPNIANTSETFGSFTYLYNRYGSGYWRYPSPVPADAAFVTDYAATHPMDDFAETFEWYVDKPDSLRAAKYAAKYKFMHIEVFVKLIFKVRRDNLAKKFSEKAEEATKQVTDKGGLSVSLHDKIFDPMREQMLKDMDATMQPSIDLAQANLDKPRPQVDMTQAEAILNKYLSRLDTLSAVAKDASARLLAYDARLAALSKPEIQEALETLTRGLNRKYANDLVKLIEKQAQALAAGKSVTAGAWPEADALQTEYDKSIAVIEPYLPFFTRINKVLKELTAFESGVIFSNEEELDKLPWTTLNKFFLTDPRRKQIKDELGVQVASLRTKLLATRKMILENIHKGIAFKKTAFDKPEDALPGIEKGIKKFAKTLK